MKYDSKIIDVFKGIEIDASTNRLIVDSFPERISENLIELPLYADEECYAKIGKTGYLIWCKDSNQLWYAPNKACLDASFIYRDDLVVKRYRLKHVAIKFYIDVVCNLSKLTASSKKCYILFNVPMGDYFVYNNKNYTMDTYGRTVPKGTIIYKFKNRFQRDFAILYFDYTCKPAKLESTDLELSDSEAMVISDGSRCNDVISAVCYYVDKRSVSKFSQSMSLCYNEKDSVTAEILGAYNALLLCKINNKTKITYYYDCSAIYDSLNNRSKYTEEVTLNYFKLVDELISNGTQITFVEIHPKSKDDASKLNKALLYFHNSCDSSCREIHRILSQGYKDILLLDDCKGKTLS